MSPQLTVSAIQTHLYWENPVQNRVHIEEQISKISSDTDIIVLPEMFTTGFSMDPRLIAETMCGETIQWMQNLAAARNCAVCGSVIIEENGNYYNRFLFVTTDRIQQYDKKHLFTMAGEHKHYEPGGSRIVIEYKDWRICPMICYDLRFPVWSRNDLEYDLLIYVANWPKTRIHAWDTLLQARAIENMCYVVGVNRIGLDGYGYEYNGHSGIYDMLGHAMGNSPATKQESVTVTLNKEKLQKVRKKLPFLDDADSFTVVATSPG